MPLPPDIDPLGLSYEGPFDDLPWPPPSWLEPEPDPLEPEIGSPFAPPVGVSDELAGAPDLQPILGAEPEPFDPFAQPALDADLAGAPVMPWEQPIVEPPVDGPDPVFAGAEPPGVRDLPDLAFYEHREQAAPQPLAFTAPGDPLAPLPSMQQEQVVDPFAGLTDQQGFARSRDLATRDPVAFEELQAQHALVRQRKAIADQLRAEDENIAAIQANREMRQRAAEKADADTQRIIADAQGLAERGIDRKGWFNNQNAAGKIGAVLGMLTGGLMSKAGGPNKGIEFIDKLMNDDIEDQKFQIEQRRDVNKMRQGAVAEAYKRSGDVYEAAEVARLATYNALINKLKTDQQNFDPRGTMFLNHGRAIQQMQGAAAKKEMELRQKRFENEIKAGEFELKQREFAAKQARVGAGVTGKLTPAQLQARYPGQPVPDAPMTEREYGQFLMNRERGADIAKKDLATSPAERARELGVPGLVDDQGNQVLFRDTGTAKEVGEMKAAATTAARLFDQIKAARLKYGWSSNLGKSDEWRKIRSDYKTAQVILKEVFKLGVIAGPDMEIIEGAMGTDDPTEVRDPLPGIENLRSNVVNIANDKFGAHAALPDGRKLQRWEPAKLALPEAKGSTDEKLLNKRSTETVDDVIKREVGAIEAARGYPLDMGDPADQALFREAYQAGQRKFDPAASVDQRARIEALAAAARTGDGTARQELESAASATTSASIKALAKAAIAALDAAKAPAPKGPRSTAVTVPDALRLDGGP